MLGAESLREVAFCQVTQRGMESAHGACASGDEIVMTLGQQTQHGDMVLGDDRTQTSLAAGDDGDRAGVMTIGLGALLVVQQSHPRCQRRRDIDHRHTDRHQLLSEQCTGAGGALDRPQPRLISARPRQQPIALVSVGDKRELVADLLVVVEHDRGM